MADDADRVFERAAELFGMLAAPMRLRIISELCKGECNVTQLLERLNCTQPNLSQHLALMYRSGVLSKRREGVQVIYKLANESLAAICRSVCTDIAINAGGEGGDYFPEEKA